MWVVVAPRYRSRPGAHGDLDQTAYGACHDVLESDHRPVYACFRVHTQLPYMDIRRVAGTGPLGFLAHRRCEGGAPRTHGSLQLTIGTGTARRPRTDAPLTALAGGPVPITLNNVSSTLSLQSVGC